MSPSEIVEMVLSHEWESWLAIAVYAVLAVALTIAGYRAGHPARRDRRFRERF